MGASELNRDANQVQEGFSAHRLARDPLEGLPALVFAHRDVAVEFDGVADIQALNLPWVPKVQPVVRLLVLEPIHQQLYMFQQFH